MWESLILCLCWICLLTVHHTPSVFLWDAESNLLPQPLWLSQQCCTHSVLTKSLKFLKYLIFPVTVEFKYTPWKMVVFQYKLVLNSRAGYWQGLHDMNRITTHGSWCNYITIKCILWYIARFHTVHWKCKKKKGLRYKLLCKIWVVLINHITLYW